MYCLIWIYFQLKFDGHSRGDKASPCEHPFAALKYRLLGMSSIHLIIVGFSPFSATALIMVGTDVLFKRTFDIHKCIMHVSTKGTILARIVSVICLFGRTADLDVTDFFQSKFVCFSDV